MDAPPLPDNQLLRHDPRRLLQPVLAGGEAEDTRHAQDAHHQDAQVQDAQEAQVHEEEEEGRDGPGDAGVGGQRRVGRSR